MATGLFSWLFGAAINSIKSDESDNEEQVPELSLIKVALFVVVSMLTYNHAIMYLDYPTVMMVKSCNILFVVMVGVFFSKVQDPRLRLAKHKIIMGIMVALGVIVFYIESAPTETSSGSKPFYGFALLFISVLADGFLPDAQTEIKEKHEIGAMTLYQNVNRWVFLGSWAASILTLQLKSIAYFLAEHPRAIIDICVEGIMSSIGQMFAYYLIIHFKQHVVPLIMTTRKAISVLLSILVYGQQL
jgi:drug/metabolite transporter (DMT)-like permease